MTKHRFFTPGWLLSLGSLVLLVVSVGLAPVEISAGSRANPKRGKVFYKTNCRTCHDGQTADVKELSPISKTMEQWAREFAPSGEVATCVTRVKDKLTTELTERDLLDIQSYLIQHAADSDQPASCGN
jgi:hypothetical protein